MKKLNKSLLTMVLVALMAFVCAFVSIGFVSTGVSASADGLARPQTATTAAADDFYVKSGARVRIVEGESGIAFASYVTKDYHESLVADYGSVEYFATAQKVGGENWSAIRFPIQPSFAESETTFELRTYINFNSLDDNEEAERLAAYATDFTIETYVKAGDTYIKAADAENGIARSMQAVANAASLDFVDTDEDGMHDEWGYTQEDVAKYFTVGERSTEITAYVFGGNGGYVTLPGVDGTKNAKVEMYAGAKSLGEFTYDADRNTYAGTLPEAGIISAFVDGKVYSTVAADAIKITDAEGMKQLQDVAASTNVYVIDADIDMSSITEWTSAANNYANAFKGVVDGMQHSLTNYTVRSNGLINCAYKAIIKNLHVEVAGYSNVRYSGTLVARSYASTFENIYVDVLSENQTGANSAAGIVGIIGSNGTTIIRDCVAVIRSASAAPAVNAGDADAFLTARVEYYVNFINSYGLNGTIYTIPAAGGILGDYLRIDGKVADADALNEATVLGVLDLDSTKLANDFLKACYANTKEAFTTIELTQDNFQEKLMGATSGYFALTEDIDMSSMTWEPTGASFTGVIDGQGHSIRNFSSPSANAYMGLLPNVNGALIRNLNMHIVTNGNRAALTGQIKGPFTVENCVFDVDTLTNSVTSGVIANVVQGTVTVNNVIINIDSANANGGIVAGNQASSANVVVSNCYFASPSLTNVFTGDNYSLVYGEDGTTVTGVKEGTAGTDGLPAVAGEDYKLYNSLTALGDAIVAGEIPASLAKAADDLGLVNAVSNVEELEAMRASTSGYFYLTNDIDMEGKAAVTLPTNFTFSGVFNGNGHTISNWLSSVSQWSGLFGLLKGATVKNVAFTDATITAGLGSVIARSGSFTFENIYLHIKSGVSNSGAALAVVEGSDSSTIMKDVTIIIDSGCASFINSTFFVSPLILDNCHFVGSDTLSVEYRTAANTAVLTGVENTDYFRYSDVAAFANAVITNKATVTDFVRKTFLANQTTAISQKNIADLQNITTGYIYLTEDIDMAEFTAWAPVAGFAATLDGNGHTIYNFTSPSGYVGLVGNTAAGATFKNLTLHAITNTSRAVLTGQIKGATTVTNCKFIVDKLAGGSAGVIANVVQGDVTVSDTYIVVLSADASQTKVGIVAGGEAASHNVTVSNVYAFSANGYITDIFVGDNCDNTALKETTLGTDGALAVAGEDYVFYANGAELAAAVDAGTIDANFKAWLTESHIVKAVTAENIVDLANATRGGYWYLTEDIDMATVDFNGEEEGLGAFVAPEVFWGVFDGKNHVISNTTGSLFTNTYVATIKNLIVKGTLTAANQGGLITYVRSGETVVDNVIVEIAELSGYASGGIVKTLAGTGMTIKNTLVIVNDSAISAENGIIFGGRYNGAFTATIENVYVVDKATAEDKVTKLCGLGTDGATAYTKLSADPVVVADASGLTVATMPTALVDLISIYDASFFG